MCKIIRYIFFATYILFTQVALSSENIYYIDMKIVMNTSLAGKSILSQLDKIDKFNKDSFKKTEALLKKEETKIISQKNILEKNEFDQKINLLKKKILEYQKERTDKKNDFTRKRNEAQSLLTKKLTPIISSYAQENSISYILTKQSIIIAKTELDLTNKIISILNDKLKTIEIK
jgi:outer membrane protein